MIYRVSGTRVQYDISTDYAFLDLDGNPILVHDSAQMIR
ncbi:DUF2813 domain-containing protein [Bacillus cereus group sp. Bce013]